MRQRRTLTVAAVAAQLEGVFENRFGALSLADGE